MDSTINSHVSNIMKSAQKKLGTCVPDLKVVQTKVEVSFA